MKKYLQTLTPRDITYYLVLLALLAVGYWLGGFGGGLLAGAASWCLILIVVGEAIFARTMARIDKQIKDHMVNS